MNKETLALRQKEIRARQLWKEELKKPENERMTRNEIESVSRTQFGPIKLKRVRLKRLQAPAGYGYCPTHDGMEGAMLPRECFTTGRYQGLYYQCRECRAIRQSIHYDYDLGRNLMDGYCNIRNRAKKKNRPFELSFDEYSRIVSQPCIYGGGIEQVGIDWKDSGLGYTKDNSLPSCRFHNEMKGVLAHDDVIKLLSVCPHLRECRRIKAGKQKDNTLREKQKAWFIN